MKCRHCQAKKSTRPRGLCWSCYYAPGVRALYPSSATPAMDKVYPPPAVATEITNEYLAEQHRKHAGKVVRVRFAQLSKPEGADDAAGADDYRGVDFPNGLLVRVSDQFDPARDALARDEDLTDTYTTPRLCRGN